MLTWLESEPAAAGVLRAMSERLGANWRELLDDPHRRSGNAFAQVLITGTSLAAWDTLKDRLPDRHAVVAGYSVGELAAFACSDVFTAAQALRLAAERATLMDRTVAGLKTGLRSVSGLPENLVLSTCAGLGPGLECAIRLNASQSIFAGKDDALQQPGHALVAIGAECKRLNVQVTSHSSWMASAAGAFGAVLDKLPFFTPLCPVAVKASGVLSRNPAELRAALSQQIARTVQWSSCMDSISERQVTCVLEMGAGSTLSQMWNARYPEIPARSLDEFHHLEGALDWVERRGG
jgi:[acyl-carrier-protein] S-malonyltransferase